MSRDQENRRPVLSEMRKIFMAMCCALLLAVTGSSGQSFVIGDTGFQLNGKPFQIISGELHYPRIPPEYWNDRLLKAKAMGLNTISTYVFWNIHEPRPGQFDFSGAADISRFVRTAQKDGLFVILRPGPYVCAEWDFGGFPAWLLKDSSLRVRSNDPRFLRACKRYLDRLGEELVPLQIAHGGNIILVQVENEYGSFGKDTVYLDNIRKLIRDAGFDVPLFSADGPSQIPNAYLHEVFPGVNGATGEQIITAVNPYRPHGPYFVPEFYPGWLDHWGEPHARVDADGVAKDVDWILTRGFSVNLYMFHGGTNFGFMNGANFGGRYQPQPTSYDYDAPLDEAGRPTPKYYRLRDVIRRHLPDGAVIDNVPDSSPTIGVPSFPLPEKGFLFDSLPRPVYAERPLPMEAVGQSYGYILYRTDLTRPLRGLLAIEGLCDYAVVYLNGRKIGSLDRRHKQHTISLDSRSVPSTLDIFVENGGRINYGKELQSNRKGITGKVSIDGREIPHWKIYPFPFSTTPSFVLSKGGNHAGPSLLRGTFSIDTVGDTFLDMRGWGKGCVWVNGHNLGRYWYIGPQQTLYVPGVWLRPGENECTVIELEGTGRDTLSGRQSPIIDSLEADRLEPPLPPRVRGTVQFSDSDLAFAGEFKPGDKPQDLHFTPRPGRFVCLRSFSSLGNDHFASAAELYVLDERGHALPRTRWKIVTVDSEELLSEDGHAENAFDGDPATIWHTEWGRSQPDHPHHIIIDLGESYLVGGFRYVPRGGDLPGKIKMFKLYLRDAPFTIDN